MVERLKDEAGYTMVEVMVAMFILAFAIIPMVSMFDTGLTVATQNGNYDQARALANQQMERVRALRFSRPEGDTTSPSVVNNYAPPTPPCVISLPQGFSCAMNTYYVNQATLARPSPALTSGTAMEVVVTIRWGGSDPNCVGSTRCYTTTSLVSKGLS